MTTTNNENDSYRSQERQDIEAAVETILAGSRRGKVTAADELAALLIPFREALSPDAEEQERRRALNSLDDVLKALFIKTPIFDIALRLWKADLLGLAVGSRHSLLELLEREIARAKEGWGGEHLEE